MKFSNVLKLLLIAIIVQSCASTKLIEEGNSAFKNDSYKEALSKYDQVIESRESVNKKAKAPVYLNAGIAALKLNQTEKAQQYLESARGLQYASPELYYYLAKVYKKIDNLSKEITALEEYHKKYPEGKDIKEVNKRLLETYVESENWDYAVELWKNIPMQDKVDIDMLANYLIVNKNLENTQTADELAKQIEQIDPNNITLLEYKAEKYFWMAENMYVTEMRAYKNNRTRSQYNKLLKALDQVWPNFLTSRQLFLKLYKMNPKPEYAKFLAQIYSRYDNKEKAAYYEKLSKQ